MVDHQPLVVDKRDSDQVLVFEGLYELANVTGEV